MKTLYGILAAILAMIAIFVIGTCFFFVWTAITLVNFFAYVLSGGVG